MLLHDNCIFCLVKLKAVVEFHCTVKCTNSILYFKCIFVMAESDKTITKDDHFSNNRKSSEPSIVPPTTGTLLIDKNTIPNATVSEPSTLKRKQTSFQITSVTVKGSRLSTDGGEDSADDLDESHTEDASSDILDCSRTTDVDNDQLSEDITNINNDETSISAPSIPIDSMIHLPVRKIAQNNEFLFPSESSQIDNVDKFDLQSETSQHVEPPTLPDQWQHRFRVVKIVSSVPFKRGRWLCMDFMDPPAPIVEAKPECIDPAIRSGMLPGESIPADRVAHVYEIPPGDAYPGTLSMVIRPDERLQPMYGIFLPISNGQYPLLTGINSKGMGTAVQNDERTQESTPSVVSTQTIQQQNSLSNKQTISVPEAPLQHISNTQSIVSTDAIQHQQNVTNQPVSTQVIQQNSSPSQQSISNQGVLPNVSCTQNIVSNQGNQQNVSISQPAVPIKNIEQNVTCTQPAISTQANQQNVSGTQPRPTQGIQLNTSGMPPTTSAPVIQQNISGTQAVASIQGFQQNATDCKPAVSTHGIQQNTSGLQPLIPNQGNPQNVPSTQLPVSTQVVQQNVSSTQSTISQVFQSQSISNIPSSVSSQANPQLNILSSQLTVSQSIDNQQVVEGTQTTASIQGIQQQVMPNIPVTSVDHHLTSICQTPQGVQSATTTQLENTNQSTLIVQAHTPPHSQISAKIMPIVSVHQQTVANESAVTYVVPSSGPQLLSQQSQESHSTMEPHAQTISTIHSQDLNISNISVTTIETMPQHVIVSSSLQNNDTSQTILNQDVQPQIQQISTAPTSTIGTQSSSAVSVPEVLLITNTQDSVVPSQVIQNHVETKELGTPPSTNVQISQESQDVPLVKTDVNGEESESVPSGTSTVAIDNKIEQAMDLVKSHLMFAVREEVDVLKEKITELMDRISQLEYENGFLRANASQQTLEQLNQSQLLQQQQNQSSAVSVNSVPQISQQSIQPQQFNIQDQQPTS